MRSILLAVCVFLLAVPKPFPVGALSYLRNRAKKCATLPDPVLSDILGPAFNSRYMSIDRPPVMEDEPIHGNGDGKRGVTNGLYPSFYVDENHAVELGNNPAWAVNHAVETDNPVLRKPRSAYNALLNDMGKESGSSRPIRGRGQNKPIAKPWECEGKIRWIDLGHEYFPRYLRTVECVKKSCWYGHYHCVPRSFTVKVLRRRTGECVPAEQLKNIGVDGLPGELRELWVWEERAVNFCCDCAAH
ncbi:protein trunk-like [Toxorhynchites rutilus septentrionalis]|uniref:protein trunk-like n=1 Tax=Toxorhynchites rutilus septentrionalis TaxID=329112 RepID=UPI0024799A30|nr:protein trunk-like [Toxorhynchites rutilus septentrionalis]